MIKTIKEQGFCHGVKAAVNTANAHPPTPTEKVYLFGDLLNNTHVMEDFTRRGYIITQDPAKIQSGTVIIRTHGVDKNTYTALQHAKIIDCTCAKVKSIHKIVSQTPAENIIIIGKNNHPEVLGILGWCGDRKKSVAENKEELKTALKSIKNGSLCVVAQTTAKKSWWQQAVKIIKKSHPTAKIHNTLCGIIAARITKAVALSKKCGTMLVAGDKKSANSLELYEACKAANPNTHFVTSLEDATKIPISPITGIVGSASAPQQSITQITDYLTFAQFLQTTQTEIDSAAEKYFANLIPAAEKTPFIQQALTDLQTQNKGGKRVRGAMVKLGTLITGKNPQNYTPLALSLAYEIFQTAILIHDDIIDRSSLRRGKPTIHTTENDPHFGTSRAICIGDYGLFLASQIIADSTLPPHKKIKTLQFFSEIQIKTLQGEIMDITLPQAKNYPDHHQAINKIYEYKTAWYTLAGPLMLGAIATGANDALLATLQKIALPLGIAFQIKDDYLGIYSDNQDKPALSDIHENKQTILYAHAKTQAAPALQKIYGNPAATPADLQKIRKIFTDTGAAQYALDEITRLTDISMAIIENEAPEKHKPLLRGLAYYLTHRSK